MTEVDTMQAQVPPMHGYLTERLHYTPIVMARLDRAIQTMFERVDCLPASESIAVAAWVARSSRAMTDVEGLASFATLRHFPERTL